MYKSNFASMEKIICVKAENDTVIWPKESEWWAQYTDGQGIAPENLLSMKDTGMYIFSPDERVSSVSRPDDTFTFSLHVRSSIPKRQLWAADSGCQRRNRARICSRRPPSNPSRPAASARHDVLCLSTTDKEDMWREVFCVYSACIGLFIQRLPFLSLSLSLCCFFFSSSSSFPFPPPCPKS